MKLNKARIVFLIIATMIVTYFFKIYSVINEIK